MGDYGELEELKQIIENLQAENFSFEKALTNLESRKLNILEPCLKRNMDLATVLRELINRWDNARYTEGNDEELCDAYDEIIIEAKKILEKNPYKLT